MDALGHQKAKAYDHQITWGLDHSMCSEWHTVSDPILKPPAGLQAKSWCFSSDWETRYHASSRWKFDSGSWNSRFPYGLRDLLTMIFSAQLWGMRTLKMIAFRSDLGQGGPVAMNELPGAGHHEMASLRHVMTCFWRWDITLKALETTM